MSIVAFDIGERNMAVCVYDPDLSLPVSHRIKLWRVFPVASNSIVSIVESFKILRSEIEGDIAIVSVERQNKRSSTMWGLMNIVAGICSGWGAELRITSPLKRKGTHHANKQAAIAEVLEMLDNTSDAYAQFYTAWKQDDLADSLLMAMHVAGDD